MPFGAISNPFGMEGIDAKVETSDVGITWGPDDQNLIWETRGTIVSTTVDAGASPTTLLRAGLVLGKITSSGKWGQYDSTATDGRERALGVLLEPLSTLSGNTGSAQDVRGRILTGGMVRAAKLNGLDGHARIAMSPRFIFDDFVPGYNYAGLMPRVINKAADYTVTAADNFTLFTMSAAATFTLPTLAAGLVFEFLNLADANMVIASASSSDNIVTDGDAGADTITYSTASHKIGARILVHSNPAADKWYTRALSLNAQTIA